MELCGFPALGAVSSDLSAVFPESRQPDASVAELDAVFAEQLVEAGF